MKHSVAAYLSKRLKQARLDRRLRQEDVAEYLQIPTSAISAIERGRRELSALELYQLCNLYQTTMDYFFGDSPLPKPSSAPSYWFESNPLIEDVILEWGRVDQALQKKAAFGLMGFLSDR
jgi:transcriptional regulator with XRE-family HTH domain